jgi:uncharacterized protein YndB with AHSA1/START domain
MNDLVLERELPAAAEKVFDFVTKRSHVMDWWGPEGVQVLDERLDFSAPGPWQSTFVSPEGRRMKVSGQVTRVERPVLVAFTWGWHDPEDRRGPETHVTIEISAAGPGRTRLVLRHVGLADEAAVEAHRKGWDSTLNKLERLTAA